MQTTVTTKNMVTIPSAVSRRMGISPGCRLDWEPVEGSSTELRVRVIPKRGDLARQLMGRGRTWLKPGMDPVGDLIDERTVEDGEEGVS